ncbi:hypothetical protein [Pedobacter hiemivivus]|uniref:Uncharacterized protein n=1 Tax=Pedobacter hiemivivus TaxID=2530454 RepID=A0A4R0MMA8_9SPHI|nr:hypothetical protein [Pedobacter hiemivivus]TCC87849.1 hypothetical protein EZ444_22220 [Pedobacter hiemivivus]
MVKKTMLALLISLSIFTAFYIYSNRNSNLKTGFNRTFSKRMPLLKSKTILEKEKYSILEVKSDRITLYKKNKPYEMLAINLALQSRATNEVAILKNVSFTGLISVAERNNYTFIMSGGASKAYRIGFDKNKVISSKLDSIPFNHAEVISPNSFVYMSKKKVEKISRRAIKKVSWQGQELNMYLPEMQIDGYFCNDGRLRYDPDSKLFVYLFYYRGNFVCLDTNLKMQYQAKTIDTVKKSKIHFLVKNGMKTHTTPPNLVNKKMSIADGKVYIQSALKADNEKESDFNFQEVIDIYDLKDGKYSVSFYLPRIDRQKLTEFKVYKKQIIALYRNTLAVFTIPNL